MKHPENIFWAKFFFHTKNNIRRSKDLLYKKKIKTLSNDILITKIDMVLKKPHNTNFDTVRLIPIVLIYYKLYFILAQLFSVLGSGHSGFGHH